MERRMKIEKVETIQLGDDSPLPKLIFVVLHTADGLTGLGETYYLPEACREVIHRDLAPQLFEQDARDIERLWRRSYDSYARFGARGAELRALSAVDVALWDLLGKAADLPVYRLLGGAVHDRIKVYNTCGGPRYGSGSLSRPGYGSAERSGEYDDFAAFLDHPAELAEELLAEGLTAMKLWPFDHIAHANGGRRITAAELAAGIDPIAKIRERVGDRIDIMVEGHGLWGLEPAIQIAQALRPYRPAWIEDLILADKPEALAELRRRAGVPVSASEYLVTRWDYHPIFAAGGADIAMVDPTWAGGITESRKIAALADTYGVPVTFHDCTGPVTLLAGVHLAAASPNTIYQETVRAYIRKVYPDLVTHVPQVIDGHIQPPETAGIGTELVPDLRNRPGVTIRVTEVARR
jgi:L-alanine-DL-glutamate epimerase-like enolase superfamily enzyme